MSNLEGFTDAELTAAHQAADRDAFAEIYDRHASAVFASFVASGASREDAANATHDVLVEAASRLRSEQPDDLRSWLLGLAGQEGEHQSTDEPISVPPALRPRVLSKVDRAGVTDSRPPWLTRERMNIGIFALVTLAVGLVGFAVAGQFEPLEPATSDNPPEAVGTTTTTTTVPPSSTTTTTSAGASTTTPTTDAPAPGVLSVSPDTVDFGADGIAGQFELSNSGGQPVEWQLQSSSDAIALSTGQGELAGGETATIELGLDREEIEEGELAETVTVVSGNGEIEVAISGEHEDNPIIHNPQASPSSVEVSGDPECTNTQTTVSARIRDTSPLESVVVRWSPDGGNQEETAMTGVGNDMFEAVIGPFTAEQSASVRIVAFDERGNAGGATTPVTVTACP